MFYFKCFIFYKNHENNKLLWKKVKFYYLFLSLKLKCLSAFKYAYNEMILNSLCITSLTEVSTKATLKYKHSLDVQVHTFLSLVSILNVNGLFSNSDFYCKKTMFVTLRFYSETFIWSGYVVTLISIF